MLLYNMEHELTIDELKNAFVNNTQVIFTKQYDDYEAMMDRMDELVKRGVSKDKAAQLVFGTKGMGDTDPNAQYIQMLNQMMQNSAYNPAAYASNNQQPQMSQEELAMLMQMMGAQG